MDAREAAMLALNACQRQGGWSDGALKKQLSAAELSGRDAALATQLCFGVLQNQMLLDFYLAKFSNIPLKRMEGKVVQTLRLGAYQMLFLTRIPHSAAVNSAVALVKAHCKNPRAAGMVNGILRSMERSLQNMPVIPQGDPVAYLSTLYSHPEWLVKEFILSLGEEETAQLLVADNSQPPTTVMVNTTRTTAETLKAMLEADHVEAEPHPWLENCLLLSRTGDLERMEAFSRDCSMCRTRPPVCLCWPPEPSRGCGCWTAAPPREGSPSLRPSPWKIRGRSSPATCTPTKRSSSRPGRTGWA